jgi:ferredoxin
MNKKVYIQTEECIGCGSCVELCPDVFEFENDEEKAKVRRPEGGDKECIEEAMASCPVECIHWKEN